MDLDEVALCAGRPMSHRARVVAAVERHLARHAPAGHWPIDERWPFVRVAGSSLYCLRCNAAGRAPLPKESGYTEAVEAFLLEHKGCDAEREGGAQ